jgi:uncharacterized membrane protein
MSDTLNVIISVYTNTYVQIVSGVIVVVYFGCRILRNISIRRELRRKDQEQGDV